MSLAEFIRISLELPTQVIHAYLDDLTDEHLMLRPSEGTNHISWQLGHLISAENQMVESVCPGTMPPLPDGFMEQHSKKKSTSDDPADFCTKAEYLEQMKIQRDGLLKVLSSLSDDDLQKPSPEHLQMMGPTVGSIIGFQAAHWMMHAGQWVIVRRNLGKGPLF